MSNSILLSVKEQCNIAPTDTAFDAVLIADINAVLMSVRQIGFKYDTPFIVTGQNETWTDLLGQNVYNLEDIKLYVGLKTRLIFDPPTIASVTEALNNIIKELEFRISIEVDPEKE